MANKLDLLKGISTNDEASLDGQGRYKQIDADTYYDKVEGESLRFQGIQARETAHLNRDEESGIPVSFGELGGNEQSKALHQLAKDKGYTNVKRLGTDGAHSRPEIDLVTDIGESYSNKVLSEGLIKPTAHTTREGNRQYELGNLFRSTQTELYEDTDWGTARRTIDEAIAQGGAPQFKEQAINEAAVGEWQYAMDNDPNLPQMFTGSRVQQRTGGRTIDNRAYNQFSEAIDVGLTGTVESMYGALDWLGDVVDSETLQGIGQNGRDRARLRTQQYAKFITDYDEVDGISDAISYIANNAAMSAPYMAASIIGAGIGVVAAPFVGAAGAVVAGTALPSILYTGNTYNEMEGEKNAGVAITSGIVQASLDRLGLNFLFKGVGGKASADVMAKAVQHLVTKGLPEKFAKQKVAAATREAIAEFAGGALKIAKSQLTARNLSRRMLSRLTVGGAGEGVTEALQEGTAYLSAVAGSDKVFNAEELNDRLIKAAVAGTALGTSFSLPGTAFDAGAWADIAYRKAPQNLANKAWAHRKADLDRKKFGHQQNIQERNSGMTAEADASHGVVQDLNQRVKNDKLRKEGRTDRKAALDLWKAIPGLFRGFINQEADVSTQDRSNTFRGLVESFGGNLQKSLSGAGLENREHNLLAEFKNTISLPMQTLRSFGFGNNKKVNIQSFSNDIYSAYDQAIQKAKTAGREVNWDTDLDGTALGSKKSQFSALHNELNTLGDSMWKKQQEHNPKLGKIDNYLLRYKSFSKKHVAKNRNGFIASLQQEYGMSQEEAINTTDNIINMEGINTVEDAFSLTSEADFKPGSHKARTLHLSENKAFSEFYERDLFKNVGNAAKSAARYITNQEFVGKNHSKLNLQLDKMEKELIESGMSINEAAARTNKAAATFKDYLDAQSGNYKRITNPYIKFAQQNLITFTTIVSLPFSTISNFVEIMMVYKGLNMEQINKTLKPTAVEFGREVANIANGITSATEATTRQDYQGGGRGIIQELGYMEWEVGAAATTGVTEAGSLRNDMLDKYFKFIGLQQWTNFTRSVRAGIAADYIVDKLTIIDGIGKETEITEEQREALEYLQNLGIDPYRLLNIKQKKDNGEQLTEQEETFHTEQLKNAMFNFINEAVALPQTANRPKIYSDPRFALFTQFQGFISTVTANHIPKLWSEYIARGTPAMKYNAFALIVTTIMMGFVSQYLKDLLKYGEPSPHFEGSDFLRRGIGASGQLGTYERLLDLAFPVYEERYSNPVSWAFGTVGGESAGLSKVGQTIDAAQSLITDDGKAGDRFSRLFLGPIGASVKTLNNWQFGDK